MFQDREQFISFLKSERSLYSYREGTDLQIIADLFKIQIHVLISRNNKMENGVPMKIGEKFGDNKIAVMVLNMEDEHYSPVLAPNNTNKNFTLMNKMKRYVEGKEDAKKDIVDDDDKQRERLELMERNLGILQSRLNFFEKEKKRSDAQIKALEETVKVLNSSKCNHKPDFVSPPAKRTDLPPVSQEPMDVEFPQLQRLSSLKNSGSERLNPVEKPLPKKALLKCNSCSIEFGTEENLKKHMESKHKVTKDTNTRDSGPPTAQPPGEKQSKTNAQSRPPLNVKNSKERNYNCESCDFQATGQGSSKALLKHSVDTGHKTNSLEEKCYTCDKVCKTFTDLMIHRREEHQDKINKCRYFLDNTCRFGHRCWYSHDQDKKNDKKDSDFQEKDSIPPDVRKSLAVLLEDLLTIHRERKEASKRKPPGA